MLSSLSAGPRVKAPDFNLFQVDMGLTENGEKQWRQVVDLVFAYCRLLNNEATKAENGQSNELQRIWGEMSQLDKMFFNQTSPGGAYVYAPNLADRTVAFGTEAVLSAGSMLAENETTFPLQLVIETVKLLDPKNCIIERCSEAAWEEIDQSDIPHEAGFGKKTEPWYGIEYFTSRIDKNAVKSWKGIASGLENAMDSSDLSLPRPNRYIPRILDIICEESKITGPRIEKPIEPPNLLVDDARGRLFHRLDDRYALPQSSLNFLIRNAAVQNVSTETGWEYDSKSVLFSSVLSGCFSEAMAQETYDADLAGLYWSLSLGPSGIRLSFSGFSDRLPDLALKILSKRTNPCRFRLL